MTRLQRFRAYMACMNPAADPIDALRDSLYVSPPGRSVADALATGLELEPASTHLVLGGIGSGKTTELLHATERLRASLADEGDHVEYCDVSRKHDLGAQQLSGVLVALAGLFLAEQACRKGMASSKIGVAKAVAALRDHAHGKTEWYPQWVDSDPPDDSGPDWYPDFRPGVIVSTEPPSELSELIPHLHALRSAWPGPEHFTVFLFDSLDRLGGPERFRDAVQHDLRVLKEAGIGVVVVGPIRFMAGTDRALLDLFDHTHFVLATDPAQPAGLAFLTQVLRRRAEPQLLPDEHLEPLARASGGTMRDLLALAKRAGEEAYAAGHDRIAPEDVTRAIDAFGRSLAIGLDDEQVKKLRHLHRTGGFVVRGEQELSLLETRRVLLYDESRYAAHPALVPLLDAIHEAA